MECIIWQLEALGETLNHLLIKNFLEEKLPYSTREKVYLAELADPQWNVTKLRALLNTLARVKLQHQTMSAPLQTNREIKKSPVAQPETPSLTMAVHFHKDQDNPKLLKSCAFCKGNHYHDQCDQYKTTNERIDRVKYLKLCCKCLRSGHVSKSCRARIKPCFYCKKYYPSSLFPTNKI